MHLFRLFTLHSPSLRVDWNSFYMAPFYMHIVNQGLTNDMIYTALLIALRKLFVGNLMFKYRMTRDYFSPILHWHLFGPMFSQFLMECPANSELTLPRGRASKPNAKVRVSPLMPGLCQYENITIACG